MLTDIFIECPLNMQTIADRVAANKDAIEKKIKCSIAKQDTYEMNSKFVCEV